MRLAHVVEARQQQTQRIDPRQILASEILAWTTPELEAAVEREIAENPALEAHDEGAFSGSASSFGNGLPTSSLEGGRLSSPTAPPVAESLTSSLLNKDSNLSPWNGPSLSEGPVPATAAMGGEPFLDPLDRVASHQSLRDHLRAQVGQVTDEPVRARMVAYLIECIDERGYLLAADLEDVASRFRVTCSEAEAAVRSLQAMDPPGVGARDLHECLLIQAEYLEQTGEGNATARRILSTCWEELASHREQRIAARLRVSLPEVQAAVRFIQSALAPYPGSAFRPESSHEGASGMPGVPGTTGGGAAVRPDIVFHRTEAGHTVELTRDYESALGVAPLWQRFADRPDAGADEAMRRYIRDHVERAQRFLGGVSRRGRTLRLIAQALIDHQSGFLETGNRAFLRPLTRQTLAERLGLDESVVSRAVADKWAQLPGGEVVALDAFFGNSHAVRDALVALIASENEANPYSDDEIADILSAQGFPLARRTVAKYRSLEKILPARLRRRGEALRGRASSASAASASPSVAAVA